MTKELFNITNGLKDTQTTESNRMGRPLKCTQEVTEELAGIIESTTLTLKDACTICGITYQSYRNWYLRGEAEFSRLQSNDSFSLIEGEEPYYQFYLAMKQAQPRRKKHLIEIIKGAATGGQEIVETKRTVKNGEIVEEITTKKQAGPQWTAAAWLLERAYSEEFGKIVRHDWRREVAEQGEDPERLMDELVKHLIAQESDEQPEPSPE